MTFLVLLVFSYNVAFLFVGTASLGLFLSSTFPSMLAYTEDILQYKGCATTVLVTGAGIGEMVLQMLVGSDAPWTLISSYPGQSPRNGKLRVLPEVKLGEGGRRRPPGSWAPTQTQVFETIGGGSGGPSLHALARIFSANPWLSR
nr:major facilitator superfamily domain-containing protein 4A isoform X1 [Halichoerus grypus]